ncbi:MAG: ARMT1-like domain-containing protein, partial [Candidatus Bathyarchaeia archaeon]
MELAWKPLMKAHLLCIPCTLRSAYDIAVKATNNENLQRIIVAETLKWLNNSAESLMNSCPAALHTYVFRLAQKISGNIDPFLRLKRESNKSAMKLASLLRKECNNVSDDEAFKLAAIGATCGNAIDFEVEGHQVPMEGLENSLLDCVRSRLTIDDTNKLTRLLLKAKIILYLPDNAGEIALDRLFVEVLAKRCSARIVAAVKSGPILNDATMEDALEVGLNDVAEVITTG